MEDQIPADCSLITLTGSAAQAGELLYQTIKRFPNSKRAARELQDEVQALLQELEGLKHLAVNYERELSVLKLPLLQCLVTCNGLSDRIDQCIKHSDGSTTRLGDWTRLQYLGEGLVNYKNVLANHKATISIALGGVTCQFITVTRQVLQRYKGMIRYTTSDLHDRLDEIEGKLGTSQYLVNPNATISREELQKMEDEKQSTIQCLHVCKGVSDYIEQYSESENRTGEDPSAPDATSQQIAGDFQKIKEERETTSRRVAVGADASNLSKNSRVNVFEDVASLDDAQQVLVSTIGDLLNAKRISTGARSLQVLGQMSDETLQCIYSRQNGPLENVVVDIEQKEGNDFRSRYGTGRSIQDEKPAKPGKTSSTQ
ncbi:hypothetical protein BJY04DRAFT_119720 [Aspergillus karnatakaensis]|uniref:uncharacterized protein n=1 Tax=Aspergillus karnatakaensis TaxID=1810916 RepID=UPI003CCD11F5